MSRVTFREPSGRWGVKGVDWGEIPDGLYGALYKLKDYEDRCEHPYLIESMMDEGDFTEWTLVDSEHNVWQCNHCGRLHRFEADGPDENGFAWGPGVGDDKATVMEVIYGLAALKEAGFDDYKEIIYYTNAEEEGGSPTAEGIVAELSQQADFAVIMDVARPNWGIVTQRKGNAKYKITVTGKGGHHGNASQCCANAIHQLAYTITELHKLASPMPGKPEDFTAKALEARGIVDSGQFIPPNTVNVGVIGSTNDKISVIPGDAYCEVNVRCFEVAEQKRLDAAIKALADKIVIDGTKVEVTGGIVTGPMEKTPAVQKMIDVYSSVVAEEFGGKVNEWVAGGLTDGNRTAKFIPTLDALGVENYDEHTDHESVDLKTAVPRTAAFAITLAELLKTGVK